MLIGELCGSYLREGVDIKMPARDVEVAAGGFVRDGMYHTMTSCQTSSSRFFGAKGPILETNCINHRARFRQATAAVYF